MSLQQPENPLYRLARIEDARLPEGWWIERLDRYDSLNPEQLSVTKLSVYDPNGGTYKNSEELVDAIRVEIFWAYNDGDDPLGYRRTTDISWPSTSDKRPVLARALAAALLVAAEAVEAEQPEVSA